MTVTHSVLQRDHDTVQIFKHTAFLYFADNSQRPDEGKEYDQLWKLRTVFDTLNKTYAKLYNPWQQFAVDEVIVKFKDRVIFW